MTINKRIVSSSLTIGAAGALLIGATFAFFSDSGTSSGNIFSTGTLDLQLKNGVSTSSAGFTDSVTATFGDSNMAPGDCTGDATLTLRNNGSIDAGSVDISASNSNGTLAPWLRINNLNYAGGNVSVAPDTNVNGWQDLSDFAVNGLPGLSGISAGNTVEFVMDVCLDQTAPNAVQGLSNTLTLTVNLNQ